MSKRDYKISRITPGLKWALLAVIVFMIVMLIWGKSIYEFFGWIN